MYVCIYICIHICIYTYIYIYIYVCIYAVLRILVVVPGGPPGTDFIPDVYRFYEAC